MATTNKRTPKQHTFVSASGAPAAQTAPGATATGNSGALRVGAIIAWVLAIGFEVIAVLAIKKPEFLGFIPQMPRLIGALVIDLILVIIGSTCWKKANHISPASRRSPVKFWLWNNLGVIVSVIAFAPFIVLLLTDKNADGKTKKLGTIIAAVALLIAGVASYDFDPVAQEDFNVVYWAAGGEVYHLDPDCSHLDRTGELVQGSVTEALEAGKQRLCSRCEANAQTQMDDGDLVDLTGRVDDDLGGLEDGLNDLNLIPDAA